MTNEIKKVENTGLAVAAPRPGSNYKFANGMTFDEIQRMTKALALSGFFGQKNLANMSPDSPEYITALAQMTSKVMAGADLGFSPTMAARSLYVVNGKIGIEGQAFAALIKKSTKYDYDVIELNETICTLQFWAFRRGGWQKMQPVTYTIEMASRAKLTGKDNWKHFPEDMLFNKAVARGARRYCADLLIGGVAFRDELEDGTADMMEMSYEVEPSGQEEKPAIPPKPTEEQPEAEEEQDDEEEALPFG